MDDDRVFSNGSTTQVSENSYLQTTAKATYVQNCSKVYTEHKQQPPCTRQTTLCNTPVRAGGLYKFKCEWEKSQTPQGDEMEDRNRNMPQKNNCRQQYAGKTNSVNCRKSVVRTDKRKK